MPVCLCVPVCVFCLRVVAEDGIAHSLMVTAFAPFAPPDEDATVTIDERYLVRKVDTALNDRYAKRIGGGEFTGPCCRCCQSTSCWTGLQLLKLMPVLGRC